MISCRTGKFARAIRWARKYLAGDVRFCTVPKLRDDTGCKCDALLTDMGKGRFRLDFERTLSLTTAVDALHHEMAHVLDIRRRGWGKDHYEQHNDNWGMEHSRIYRDYWAWVDREKAKQKGRK